MDGHNDNIRVLYWATRPGRQRTDADKYLTQRGREVLDRVIDERFLKTEDDGYKLTMKGKNLLWNDYKGTT